VFGGGGGAVPVPGCAEPHARRDQAADLGLLVVVTGLAVSLRTWAALSTMLLIVALQLATSPVSAHLVGRAAYRSGQYRRDLVDHDDLADDLTAAGFDLTDQAGDDHVGPDTDAG
jgi:multicomponent Na+:H+ antiporter subunit G